MLPGCAQPRLRLPGGEIVQRSRLHFMRRNGLLEFDGYGVTVRVRVC